MPTKEKEKEIKKEKGKNALEAHKLEIYKSVII